MNPLHSRLAVLRRRLRLVALVRGVSLLLLVVLGGIVLAGLLDWSLDLPGLVRAPLLLAILAGAALIGYHYLLAPLKVQSDDLTLALRIEAAYPILNDALASTVQFLEQPGTSALAGSLTMRREAVTRAMRLAQGCDFNKVVNSRGLRLTGLASLLVVGLTIFFCLWSPALARTALLRLANPYGEHDWPRATELALEFRDRVAIGQPFTIQGKVSGVIPPEAIIEFEGLATSREVKKYPIKADQEGKTGSLLAKLDMTRQNHPFRFRVHANDAVSPRREGAWHTVTVAQPPRLASLNGLPTPQVELYFPAYTDLPSPLKLSPGSGHIEAVAGTRAILRAAADRPIARARIYYRPGHPLAIEAAYLAPIGYHSPVEAVALAVGGQQVWDRVAGQLEPDGRRFTIEFQPWISGAYVLSLEDADGLGKEYEFDLRVVPDPSPVVTLERPSTNQSVLPDAESSLQLTVDDEMFGIRSAYLEYRRRDKDGRPLDDEPGRLPLFDHQAVGEALPQLLTALAGNPIPLPTAVWRLRPKRLELTRRWSLGGLGKEGDVIVIQACAEDFNDVTAHVIPGRSHEVELRIVGRSALNAILDEAQAKVQQELLRLREWEEKALKKVIEAEQQVKSTGKVRPEDFDGLVEAEQLQRQIQARVGTTREEGLRAELQRIEQMMRDNKLPPSGAEDRLKVMKEELERLAQEHLPQIEPQLTTARQKLAAAARGKDAAERKDNKGPKETRDSKDNKESKEGKSAKGPNQDAKGELNKARAHQEEVQQTLDNLLKYLDRWASTQEIKGEVRAVLKEQKDLQADTEKINKDFAPNEPQAQAALRRTGEFQRRLAERTQRLIDKMDRVAQERKEKDPGTAEMLDKAAEVARKADLPGEMRDTDEQLKLQQINRAINQQGESIKTLEKMVQSLEESRQADVERLVKRQREEQKNLDDLGKELEQLRKKVEEARNNPDPEQRKAELQKLAQKQRELEEAVKEKSRELARLQAWRAGRDLAKAAEQMGRAAKQLDDGEDPEEAQKEAKDRLEKAQEELKQAENAAEDELAREQLAKIADQLKGLKEREDASIEESTRIHQAMLKAGWRRQLLDSLKNHADNQTALGKETASLSEKLKGAPVFEMVLKKAGKAMEAAAKSMQERKENGVLRQEAFPFDKEVLADEQRADSQTQDLQKEASRRLDRLLEALKQQMEAAQKRPDEEQGGGEKGGAQGGGKGIRAGDGIPALAQLKALREEQHEVNDRTKAFAERNPDRNKLTPEERTELEAIQAEQVEVFRLLRELTTAANEGGKE